MTTFITGGTSSIGRVLIKELHNQHEPLKVLVRRSSNLEGLVLKDVEFVYGDVTDAKVVQDGMVFTIEPGVYIQGLGGVRLESLVHVTAGGVEVLSGMEKKVISL